MRQNKRFAFDFIDTLTGNGLDAMHWRTVPDRERGKGRNYDGTIKEVWDDLCRDNDEGRGIFAIANKADGHNDASVTGYRAFFVDEDKGRFPNYKVEPSFLVHTARGHHAYWFCTEGTSQEDWVNCQWSMIQALGTDDSIFNPSRIMRVPGFFHCKEEPTMVTMEVLHDRSLRWSSEVFLGLMDIPLVPREKKAPRVKPEAVEIDSEQTVSRAQAYIGAVPYPAEGERNPEIYKMAAKFKDMGLSKDEAFTVIERWGADQRHALDDDELSCVVDNAYRYGENEPGCDAAPSEVEFSDDDTLALEFIKRYGKQLLVDGNVYALDGHVWRRMIFDEIECQIRETLRGLQCNGKRVNLSSSKVQGITRFVTSSNDIRRTGFFDNAPKGVSLEDKFLRMDDDGEIYVEENSPENGCRFGLSFTYKEGGRPDGMFRLLEAVFGGDDDIDEKIAFFQEFIGLALVGRITDREAACVLYGPEHCGKSSVIAVVEALFGRNQISHVEPQYFSNRNEIRELDGTPLNSCADIPADEIRESNIVKRVVTGEPVTAKFLFKDTYTFRPQAAQLWSCNELPESNDLSGGFFRRFRILEFTKAAKGDRTHNEIVQDVLKDGPALINWFLEGASRAHKARTFTMPDSHSEIAETWRRRDDAVYDLIASEYQRDEPPPKGAVTAVWVREGNWVGGQRLWEQYKDRCVGMGLPVLPRPKFYAAVRRAGVHKVRLTDGVFYSLYENGKTPGQRSLTGVH